jgi:predicted DNA-binding protein YlxM (UPF0122 family)
MTHTINQEAAVAATQAIVDKAIPRLYRVEEIAEALNRSVSYVHQHIAKEKPPVYAMDGKAHLFSSEYVEHLRSLPYHTRTKKQQKQVTSALHTEEHSNIFQRMAKMEQEIVRLKFILGA